MASSHAAIWRFPFMSDADFPTRFGLAARAVLAGIFLFVFALGISESFRDGQVPAGAVYLILFIITLVVAVKWKPISDAVARWRQKMAWILVALGFGGALALGVAIGGLLLRGGPLTAQNQSTGRITWSFDQSGDNFFLGMGRVNDQELRILGFQSHGKNTSTDPVSEFSGIMR
jgi:hypothetical protein